MLTRCFQITTKQPGPNRHVWKEISHILVFFIDPQYPVTPHDRRHVLQRLAAMEADGAIRLNYQSNESGIPSMSRDERKCEISWQRYLVQVREELSKWILKESKASPTVDPIKQSAPIFSSHPSISNTNLLDSPTLHHEVHQCHRFPPCSRSVSTWLLSNIRSEQLIFQYRIRLPNWKYRSSCEHRNRRWLHPSQPSRRCREFVCCHWSGYDWTQTLRLPGQEGWSIERVCDHFLLRWSWRWNGWGLFPFSYRKVLTV